MLATQRITRPRGWCYWALSLMTRALAILTVLGAPAVGIIVGSAGIKHPPSVGDTANVTIVVFGAFGAAVFVMLTIGASLHRLAEVCACRAFVRIDLGELAPELRGPIRRALFSRRSLYRAHRSGAVTPNLADVDSVLCAMYDTARLASLLADLDGGHIDENSKETITSVSNELCACSSSIRKVSYIQRRQFEATRLAAAPAQPRNRQAKILRRKLESTSIPPADLTSATVHNDVLAEILTIDLEKRP